MSSFTEYAVDVIFRKINPMILNSAFAPSRYAYSQNRASLHHVIASEIVQNIVMVDANIVGGEIITIPLLNLPWTYYEDGIEVKIPLSASAGRPITSVLSLEEVLRGMEPMQRYQGCPGRTGSAEVFLVGPNTIFTSVQPLDFRSFLRCSIGNDPNLNNFNERFKLLFAELAVLAAKGTIHTRLSMGLTIDSATGGQVDGRMREVIDSYADAWELYDQKVDIDLRRASVLNDRGQHHRLIRIGMGR